MQIRLNLNTRFAKDKQTNDKTTTKVSLYLNLWFGEFLAFAYNDHKALVNIILGKLVVKTSKVFLQFANSSLIVRQQGQTESQITPLPFSSTRKKRAKSKSQTKMLGRKEMKICNSR